MDIINNNSFNIANEIRKMIVKGWNENALIIDDSDIQLFEKYGCQYLIDVMNNTKFIKNNNNNEFIIKYQNYFIEINYKSINKNKFIINLKLINN